MNNRIFAPLPHQPGSMAYMTCAHCHSLTFHVYIGLNQDGVHCVVMECLNCEGITVVDLVMHIGGIVNWDPDNKDRWEDYLGGEPNLTFVDGMEMVPADDDDDSDWDALLGGDEEYDIHLRTDEDDPYDIPF